MTDAQFLAAAVDEARAGRAEGGVPIGCVLVRDGHVVARGHNRRVQNNSAILHAEMDAIEATGRRPAAFYRDLTLYTTLSPCAMCAGAILLYGIPRVVVGERDNFRGEMEWLIERGVEVTLLDDPDCQALMTEFTGTHSDLWHEDIGESPM